MCLMCAGTSGDRTSLKTQKYGSKRFQRRVERPFATKTRFCGPIWNMKCFLEIQEFLKVLDAWDSKMSSTSDSICFNHFIETFPCKIIISMKLHFVVHLLPLKCFCIYWKTFSYCVWKNTNFRFDSTRFWDHLGNSFMCFFTKLQVWERLKDV